MKDVLNRMMDEMPITRCLNFVDPISTSWVMMQAAVISNRPEDPGYDAIAQAIAKIIKSEPYLRSKPKLLALAEEVLGSDNVLTTPLTAARSLDSELIPIRNKNR